MPNGVRNIGLFAAVGIGMLLATAGASAVQTDAGSVAPPPPSTSSTATVNPSSPTGKPIEFSDLGKAIAGPDLKLPADATPVRQVSAPLGDNGETVLLNFYKKGDDLFADVLTSRSGQPWTMRNHLLLPSPLSLRPEKMSVTMRYLEPHLQRGFLIVASDEAGDLTIAFPKGFGGSAFQQQFLASSPPGADIRRAYDFDDMDSRGFVIVKATVEATGQVKPSGDVGYYVWNGKQFIPRKRN